MRESIRRTSMNWDASLITLGMSLALAVAIGGLVCLSMVAGRRSRFRRESILAPREVLSERVCCYCLWGEAYLIEDIYRRTPDGTTLVRCYVCRACGLPQWHVSKVPLLTLAEK
jgi:hypothetical protein